MRVITANAAAAFKAGVPFNQANTRVEISGRAVHLFLHNNLIATKFDRQLWIRTMGWATATTADRLSGIVPDVHKLKFRRSEPAIYYNGDKLESYDWLMLLNV